MSNLRCQPCGRLMVEHDEYYSCPGCGSVQVKIAPTLGWADKPGIPAPAGK